MPAHGANDGAEPGLRPPLVSVVTVSLNSERHIEQAMLSVLSQDLEQLEYLVIDGGSTDGTLAIVRRYEDRLACIDSAPDRGIYDAFNRGLRRARGDWLLFLNSDDYLASPDVLSRLAAETQRAPNPDLVFGRIMRVDRTTGQPKGAPFGGPFQWRKMRFRNIIPHPAALTSRRYFERVGSFRDDFRIAGDYELLLRGGPSLQARFVPTLITCMREGGASRLQVARSLAEWLHAVRTHHALPATAAHVVYLYLLARSLVSLSLRSAASALANERARSHGRAAPRME